jgi:hypothetical protein
MEFSYRFLVKISAKDCDLRTIFFINLLRDSPVDLSYDIVNLVNVPLRLYVHIYDIKHSLSVQLAGKNYMLMEYYMVVLVLHIPLVVEGTRRHASYVVYISSIAGPCLLGTVKS